ncbi:methyl-accepting chemotaxis protein [Alginatibacterium sediminis]|uniref:Methyl-accepting chemotaxis protein n=1 Tax=Alginatibacterium sediminis TaxID=2164068 RepID=A0A420E5W7_9ALTE|nr:methyl-accepting chemotaxis protein [Alginatibacterium sediminis]RKF13183.1 methyl-accepting chemotaxis protein [Alginatibacterium sediminis]
MRNSIKFQMTVSLAVMGLMLIVVASLGFRMGSKTESELNSVNQKILPALEAVLNGDRDLYQAQQALLQALIIDPNSSELSQKVNNYEGNARQAKNLMNLFERLFAEQLNASETTSFRRDFERWEQASRLVFTKVKKEGTAQAIAYTQATVEPLFETLREHYDTRTEIVEVFADQVNVKAMENISENKTIMVIVTLISIGFSIIVAYFGPTLMVRALDLVQTRIDEIASGDGDLTLRIASTREDEIGKLSNSFDAFVAKLETLIKSISDQSSTLEMSMGDLNSSTRQSADIGQEQSKSVELVATAVNEMSVAIREVANNASHTAEEINQVNLQAEQSQQVTLQSKQQIESLSETVAAASKVIQRLSEDSNSIASVLDVIRGIAEQTNLLALNAAIEAARAGEQGRGFAVVADEVRNLASKTQQSTEDIQKMIETLQNRVTEAVDSIALGSSAAEMTVELADKTQLSLAQILEYSSSVAEVSASTATSTEEQSHVTEDIDRNLVELADKTRSNSELSAQTTAVAQRSLNQAQQLKAMLSQFKTS